MVDSGARTQPRIRGTSDTGRERVLKVESAPNGLTDDGIIAKAGTGSGGAKRRTYKRHLASDVLGALFAGSPP